MNKADLINKMADDTGITKTQANAAIDSFTEAVTRKQKKKLQLKHGKLHVSKQVKN